MRRLLWFAAVIVLAWLLAQALFSAVDVGAQSSTRTPWPTWTPRPTAMVTPTRWPTTVRSRTATARPSSTPTPTPMPACGEWEPTQGERYEMVRRAWSVLGQYEDDPMLPDKDPLLVVGMNDYDLGAPAGLRLVWKAGVVLRPFCGGIVVWRGECPKMLVIGWDGRTRE